MTPEDFEASPFDKPEEWRRLRRVMHEHDETREIVEALVLVVRAAGVIRRVAPWAIGVALAVLAYANKGLLMAGVG